MRRRRVGVAVDAHAHLGEVVEVVGRARHELLLRLRDHLAGVARLGRGDRGTSAAISSPSFRISLARSTAGRAAQAGKAALAAATAALTSSAPPRRPRRAPPASPGSRSRSTCGSRPRDHRSGAGSSCLSSFDLRRRHRSSSAERRDADRTRGAPRAGTRRRRRARRRSRWRRSPPRRRARHLVRPRSPAALDRDAVGDRPGEERPEQHDVGERAVGEQVRRRPDLHREQLRVLRRRLMRPGK